MCHNGPAAGRRVVPEDGRGGTVSHRQPGRRALWCVTGRDADRFSFKVPTLRNVELTYPYIFHDGAADTLVEAVDVMGRIQLGKRYTVDERDKIVAFLKSLTGDQPTS